jgi:Fur family peroxide stress response transcriptional regulator
MICAKCGEVLDIESDLLKNIPSNISDELDVKIISCNISFQGICKRCTINQ